MTKKEELIVYILFISFLYPDIYRLSCLFDGTFAGFSKQKVEGQITL
jgi:hypothetical protein